MKKEKYQYWIIKTYNKKRKKVLYRSRNYENCKRYFNTLMKLSKKVTIQKKNINRGKLIPVHIELLLITNDLTQKKNAYENKSIINTKEDWLIVQANRYQEEERFYCYPDKKTIEYSDILNFLKEKNASYSIYLYFNKMIIDSSLKVEKAIVFKTINEATEVYNKLIKESLKVIFLGKLNKNKRMALKDKIMNDVGIAYINLCNKKSIH